MANDLGLEFAFDLDSHAKGRYEGYLESACTSGKKLASINKLKKADTIFFAIYDESDDADIGRGTPVELRITFASADASTSANSPLSVTSLTFTTFYSRGSKDSPQYKDGPSWYAQAPGDEKNDRPTTYELVNPGHFFFTAELDVQYQEPGAATTTKKTFGQDPRMDVDT
jgi:hypothetical protein